MTETSTSILLVRHGLNDYIATGRLAGRIPGVHLNDEGRAQAEALADRLAGAAIAAVYSSPLERARETAEPLAARLATPVLIADGVTESDCGEWTGRATDELRPTRLWLQIHRSPSSARFPGGESLRAIQKRTMDALDALRQAHAGCTIAVFSHADPIRMAVAHCIGVPFDLYHRLLISPASITEIEFTSQQPLLRRLNDCAHIPAPAPTGAT